MQDLNDSALKIQFQNKGARDSFLEKSRAKNKGFKGAEAPLASALVKQMCDYFCFVFIDDYRSAEEEDMTCGEFDILMKQKYPLLSIDHTTNKDSWHKMHLEMYDNLIIIKHPQANIINAIYHNSIYIKDGNMCVKTLNKLIKIYEVLKDDPLGFIDDL